MPDHWRPRWQTDEVSDIGELLDLVNHRPAWHADAACREHPDVNFFPGQGDDPRPAKTVCGGCLAKPECLAWALEQNAYLDGIWAGTTSRERRALRVGRAA